MYNFLYYLGSLFFLHHFCLKDHLEKLMKSCIPSSEKYTCAHVLNYRILNLVSRGWWVIEIQPQHNGLQFKNSHLVYLRFHLYPHCTQHSQPTTSYYTFLQPLQERACPCVGQVRCLDVNTLEQQSQPFWHQGPFLWKTIFPWTGGRVWFRDDSSTLLLLCILFLLLLILHYNV